MAQGPGVYLFPGTGSEVYMPGDPGNYKGGTLSPTSLRDFGEGVGAAVTDVATLGALHKPLMRSVSKGAEPIANDPHLRGAIVGAGTLAVGGPIAFGAAGAGAGAAAGT